MPAAVTSPHIFWHYLNWIAKWAARRHLRPTIGDIDAILITCIIVACQSSPLAHRSSRPTNDNHAERLFLSCFCHRDCANCKNIFPLSLTNKVKVHHTFTTASPPGNLFTHSAFVKYAPYFTSSLPKRPTSNSFFAELALVNTASPSSILMTLHDTYADNANRTTVPSSIPPPRARCRRR